MYQGLRSSSAYNASMAVTATRPKRLSASTPEGDTSTAPGSRPASPHAHWSAPAPATCAGMGTHPHPRRSSHCCGGGDGGEFHVLLGGCGCAALHRELAHRFPLTECLPGPLCHSVPDACPAHRPDRTALVAADQ
jgi:hypothetical protein